MEYSDEEIEAVAVKMQSIADSSAALPKLSESCGKAAAVIRFQRDVIASLNGELECWRSS